MENILLDDFILDKEENFSPTERDDLRQLLLEANLKVTKETNEPFELLHDVGFCLSFGHKSKQ